VLSKIKGRILTEVPDSFSGERIIFSTDCNDVIIGKPNAKTKMKQPNWAWWYPPVIPPLRRMRREDLI
jgi:hypothetical protein